MYDAQLECVSQALQGKYSDFTAVDIGANVGDTAAAISAHRDVPVLCLEADPGYLPYLRRNAKTIGAHIVLEESYIGESSRLLSPCQLQRTVGTTSAAGALRGGGGEQRMPNDKGAISVRRLEDVLKQHALFANAKLIKSDTDGFDFNIIISHADLLSWMKPVVYFEYTVDSVESAERAAECIKALVRSGYVDFTLFDNYGSMMGVYDAADFADLNHYLLSNAYCGRAVYYCDVLAATAGDVDVALTVRETMHARLSRRIGSREVQRVAGAENV